jgi:hypothetical protein
LGAGVCPFIFLSIGRLVTELVTVRGAHQIVLMENSIQS